ncbi:MAG: hypothetical protein R6V86_08200 [Spirochaetia bacterium]
MQQHWNGRRACRRGSQKIITKAPSAGLWDGQSDEDEIGLTYREIDYYIVEGEADSETAAKIEAAAAANQHKLELPAIPDF